MRFVYGPVASWRLGRSLGVDIISTKKKTCSFDCVYCQLGRTENKTAERKVYVETDVLLARVFEGLDLGYKVTSIERFRRRHSGKDLFETTVYARKGQ